MGPRIIRSHPKDRHPRCTKGFKPPTQWSSDLWARRSNHCATWAAWTNLNSLHPRIMCTKFDWIWPASAAEEDFKQFLAYFYSFAIISPWKRAIPFILTNLNPLPPKMSCAKFGLNWPSGSGEEVENVNVYRQTDGQRAIRIAKKWEIFCFGCLSFQDFWLKLKYYI